MKFSALSTTIAIAAALTSEVSALGGVPNVELKGYEGIYGNKGQVERNMVKRQQAQYQRQYIPDPSLQKRDGEEDITTETSTVFVTVTLKRDGTTVTPAAAPAQITDAASESEAGDEVVEVVATTAVTERTSSTRLAVVTSTGEPIPDEVAATFTSTITPAPIPEPTTTAEPTTTEAPVAEETQEAKPSQTYTTVTMTTCETICSTATPTPVVETPEVPEVPQIVPPFPSNSTIPGNHTIPSNSTIGNNYTAPIAPPVIHSTFTVIPVAPEPTAGALVKPQPVVEKGAEGPVSTPNVDVTIADSDDPAIFDGAAGVNGIKWSLMAFVGVVGAFMAL